MKRNRLLLIAVLLAVMACGNSTGPDQARGLRRIAGAWNLFSIKALPVADTTATIDVPLDGLLVSINIVPSSDSEGTARLVVGYQGYADTSFVLVGMRGDTLSYWDGSISGPWAIYVGLSGRTMHWRWTKITAWDANGDGTPEQYYEYDTWRRP